MTKEEFQEKYTVIVQKTISTETTLDGEKIENTLEPFSVWVYDNENDLDYYTDQARAMDFYKVNDPSKVTLKMLLDQVKGHYNVEQKVSRN